MKKVAFQVNTRLAKLLSENYRSSGRAIKELIDNAWDACAKMLIPMKNKFIILYCESKNCAGQATVP